MCHPRCRSPWSQRRSVAICDHYCLAMAAEAPGAAAAAAAAGKLIPVYAHWNEIGLKFLVC